MTYPDWTERVTDLSGHRGLWPLGLEPVGFSFARQLLPGLTNVTTDIRYYSFFCWAFWTFEKHLHAQGTTEFNPADQKRWLARLENLFRAATLYSDPDVLGLAGVTSAVRLNDADEVLPLDATGCTERIRSGALQRLLAEPPMRREHAAWGPPVPGTGPPACSCLPGDTGTRGNRDRDRHLAVSSTGGPRSSRQEGGGRHEAATHSTR